MPDANEAEHCNLKLRITLTDAVRTASRHLLLTLQRAKAFTILAYYRVQREKNLNSRHNKRKAEKQQIVLHKSVVKCVRSEIAGGGATCEYVRGGMAVAVVWKSCGCCTMGEFHWQIEVPSKGEV